MDASSLRLRRFFITAAAMLTVASRVIAAPCVGDCGGQPGVSIDEVQHTINIFLGNADLADCPNADRDHNQHVSIDEVQASILSFLADPDSCPTVVPEVEDPTLTPTSLPSATATPSETPTETGVPTETSVPTDTSVPTVTRTPTPTATPTVAAVCGNGFLESGETCTSCAADCVIHACTATTPLRTFGVNFAAPAQQSVSGLTLLIGYRSSIVSLPGTGSATSVAARVKNKPANAIFSAFDLDYALRTVLSRSSPFTPGRLFTIDFDSCSGATAPTAADFGCTIQGCANSFGDVDDCTCTVTAP
ncbi:MAG TPA: hypothetical protein VL403_00785 [Candidatus Kryptonia bacterium]|nr:hypothetical protein [Candidatus Kryptonia bacterium]